VLHCTVKCYTSCVPTTRRRHAITETEDIKSALAAAQQRWPALAGKPGQLLVRLILAGSQAIQHEDMQARIRRAADIEATKGVLAGVYGRDYLTRLREDWPA
jgi:hypothetical protein